LVVGLFFLLVESLGVGEIASATCAARFVPLDDEEGRTETNARATA
jgi:hypothetical protein